MPAAQIKINAVVGSNNDLPINTIVNLDNQNIGGETSFLWTIIDQPPGAADALSSTIIQNPTFTPKKEGTYLIQLQVNGNPLLIDLVIVGIRNLKTRDRIPAAHETDEDSLTRGWAKPTHDLWTRLVNLAGDPGVVVGRLPAGGTEGTFFTPTSRAILKTGLPGQEDIANFLFLGATTDLCLRREMFLLLGGVDGAAVVPVGGLARLRKTGLFAGGPAGVVAQAVYADNAGALSATPGTVPRRVGHYLTTGAPVFIWIDGGVIAQETPALLMDENGAAGPADSLPGGVRVRNNAGVFEVSENTGPYTPVFGLPGVPPAPSNALYLLNSALALASLPNAVLTQLLASLLIFRPDSDVVRVQFRRFTPLAGVSNILEFRNSTGTILLTAINNSGQFDSNGKALPNVLDPVALQDAATKNYVDNNDKLKQTVSTRISVNTTIVSVAFVTLLTINITKQLAGTNLLIFASIATSNNSAAGENRFRVQVDAVTQDAAQVTMDAADEAEGAAFALSVSGIAAGVRTVRIQWRVTSGTGSIQPVLRPEQEHASLIVQEVLP